MTEPTFSVVIPTHDRDDTLVQAVTSAAGQTLPPLEIIVVDDNPSPVTRQNMARLDKEFGCDVRYVENPDNPNGTYGSRNMGAELVRGTHMANLDDDDYWDPEYLEKSARLIRETGADIVLSPITAFTDQGEFRPGKTPPADYRFKDFVTRNPGVISSNAILSRQGFFAAGGYDMSVHGSSDKDIFIQMKSNGCRHVVHAEPLVFWRTAHSGQWSVDSRRLLPGVLGFYRKYASRMSPLGHLRMLAKIAGLAWRGYVLKR